MVEAQHLIVEGLVQGVGFRFFTKTRADEIGVAGWVRNLADGRVEAMVQGEALRVAEFVDQVRKGPQRGRVDDVRLRKIDLQDGIKEFQIVENGEEPCHFEKS